MNYEFKDLSGIQSLNLNTEFHFIGTGMLRDYDMGWMSTAPRRDFGSGVSGSHLAMKFETCATELKLVEPYPGDSYHIVLTGSVQLLDLRKAADATFSGSYYSDDRSISCQIVDANIDYLKSYGFDGILRYSKPMLDAGTFEDIVAISSHVGSICVPDPRTKLLSDACADMLKEISGAFRQWWIFLEKIPVSHDDFEWNFMQARLCLPI